MLLSRRQIAYELDGGRLLRMSGRRALGGIAYRYVEGRSLAGCCRSTIASTSR